MLWRRNRFTKFLLAISALWAAVPQGFAQTAANPLGMVIGVEGTVTIQRGPANERAQLADFLFAGDQIVTAANSKVMFSFCPASERISLNAGSTAVIGPAAIQQPKGAPATRTAGTKCTLPQVALGKRDIEHIGAMAARGAPPIPLYVGGIISSARPQFMWAPVPAAKEYTLTVKTRSGEIRWTWNHSGEASEVRLPDTVSELQAGAYVWQLTGLANGRVVAQQEANFEVKPSAEFPSAWPRETASLLELAAIFENAEYYTDAAAIYRMLQSQNGNDPRFTRQLLWLYWNAGLFAASNDELQKMRNPK